MRYLFDKYSQASLLGVSKLIISNFSVDSDSDTVGGNSCCIYRDDFVVCIGFRPFGFWLGRAHVVEIVGVHSLRGVSARTGRDDVRRTRGRLSTRGGSAGEYTTGYKGAANVENDSERH